MNEFFAVACVDNVTKIKCILIYDNPDDALELAELLAVYDGKIVDPAFYASLDKAVDPLDIGLSTIDWNAVRKCNDYNDRGFSSVYIPDNRSLRIYLTSDGGNPYAIWK